MGRKQKTNHTMFHINLPDEMGAKFKGLRAATNSPSYSATMVLAIRALEEKEAARDKELSHR